MSEFQALTDRVAVNSRSDRPLWTRHPPRLIAALAAVSVVAGVVAFAAAVTRPHPR